MLMNVHKLLVYVSTKALASTSWHLSCVTVHPILLVLGVRRVSISLNYVDTLDGYLNNRIHTKLFILCHLIEGL